MINRDNYQEKFWALPASDLLYVGPATARKLARYGVHTIGELAELDEAFLRGIMGKWGGYLWTFANGHDISPVLTAGHESTIKSIGNSMTTYRDVETFDEAWQVLLILRNYQPHVYYVRQWFCLHSHLTLHKFSEDYISEIYQSI